MTPMTRRLTAGTARTMQRISAEFVSLVLVTVVVVVVTAPTVGYR